ncbi:gamma-glutamylcyclotransferase family protein [Paenibacillus donghaensis]|uniref:Gamma-glutamylcyclotransferase n=1 Tax=Paenibacillus donghaensis TaxID=414771 RepID=A0A2Z2KW50_9BACL|nr:gamma-glutamylcyclotransferase family protein [Paenibacillus donghaensis]ASA25631.1 hypothetical protein B9T62_35800 [Paenibacillus donghaensis]
MKRSILYAAYGSNMSMRQMTSCCNIAMIVGCGVIENYELEFYSLATITKCPGLNVPIVLWRISESEVINLDYYEGVSKGLYRKETLTVTLQDGKRVRAMVYVMNLKSEMLYSPSPVYYCSILEGYKENGIEVKPLAIAAIKAGARFQSNEGKDTF